MRFENSEHKTLLHFASENNDLDMIEFLIMSEAQVDAADIYKITPLMLACRWGHVHACALLLASRANMNLHDQFRWVPLNYAIFGDHLDVVQLLVLSGADLGKDKYDAGVSPLDQAQASGKMLIHNFLSNYTENLNIQIL